MATYLKDPSAVLDYGVDWSKWLQSGETITTSTWTVVTGITKDTDTHGSTSAVAWLSGGTAGSTYAVTNHIVTNQGRTDERTITIRVENR